MLKTCGIEIKGSTAIVVVLEGDTENFKVIPTEFKKINLENSNNQKAVKSFYKVVSDFFKTNNFDKIGIKERATKGKFSGGSATFKIEGLIQISDFPVVLVHGRTIKAKLKNKEIDCSEVNSYQAEAMRLAYCLMLEK